jgi:aspartyl-tRNA(Asn)/glutamyl-tRNA(Gln) amidotransferase subunit B
MTQPLSAQYLENVIQENTNIKVLEDQSSPGVVASWIIGEVYGQLRLHNMSIEEFPIKHKQLGELINLVENGKLSRLHGKNIIKGMISDPTKSASEMADALGLLQINDDALTVSFCNQVLEENAKIVCS